MSRTDRIIAIISQMRNRIEGIHKGNLSEEFRRTLADNERYCVQMDTERQAALAEVASLRARLARRALPLKGSAR